MEKWYEATLSDEEIEIKITEKVAQLRDISIMGNEKEKAAKMMDWLGDPEEFNIIASKIKIEKLSDMLELMTGLKEFVHDYPYKVMEENIRLKNMGNYIN